MARKTMRGLLTFNSARRMVQLLSFISLSAIVFELGTQPLLLPVLWTWGLKQNVAGDAFTALQFAFSGWNTTTVVFPWLAVASFLIVGVLIGKSLCGWVCPFGFIQELVGFIRRKQTEFSLRTHESMVYLKYFVLAISLFISATFAATKVMGISQSYEGSLGVLTTAPFTVLSPAETLFATLPNMVFNFRVALVDKTVFEALSGVTSLSPYFWTGFILLCGALILSAYVPRGWCKYFCPHGAIMAILSRFSFLGLRRDPVKCARGGCRACVAACPMRVPILDLPWEKFSDPECIYCMRCADACQDGAIKLKYP